MKKIYFILVILFVLVLFPSFAQDTGTFRQEGIASWYGREFDGRPTASGETFDSSKFTAAHPNLPFGTILVVTNLHNNRSVTVRVNDRGPFVPARIVDISRAAAEQLDMIVTGTAPVKIESSDRFLSATSVGSLQTTPQVTPAAAQVLPQTTSQPVPQAAPQVTPVQVVTPVITSVPQVVVPAAATPVVTVTQPVVVSQPVVTVTQPVVTSQPVVTVTQPVVASQPIVAVTQPIVASQPVAVQAGVIHSPVQVRLVPAVSIVPGNSYRLQIGSFRVARNAVDAFDRLKNAGLTPNYERYTDESNVEYYRVVIAGVKGSDVQSTAEKIGAAGFREAIIREEN